MEKMDSLVTIENKMKSRYVVNEEGSTEKIYIEGKKSARISRKLANKLVKGYQGVFSILEDRIKKSQEDLDRMKKVESNKEKREAEAKEKSEELVKDAVEASKETDKKIESLKSEKEKTKKK